MTATAALNGKPMTKAQAIRQAMKSVPNPDQLDSNERIRVAAQAIFDRNGGRGVVTDGDIRQTRTTLLDNDCPVTPEGIDYYEASLLPDRSRYARKGAETKRRKAAAAAKMKTEATKPLKPPTDVGELLQLLQLAKDLAARCGGVGRAVQLLSLLGD